MVVDRNTQHGKILTNRPTGSGHIDHLICWLEETYGHGHRPAERLDTPGSWTIHALYVPTPMPIMRKTIDISHYQQVDFSSR